MSGMYQPVVAVALSGGVDSLVSGYLLKQQFRQVFGIHFKTGYESGAPDVENLGAQLDMPVHTVDLSGVFETEVVSYLIDTYLGGRTPNPCFMCNPKIKFGALLDAAKGLGAQFLATGHYAGVVNAVSFPDRQIPRPWLEKGEDPRKDQSYFLARLTPDQLDRVIFPLAGYTKDRVKALAARENLVPLSKGESQDICFIRDGDLSQFIIQKKGIDPQKGPIRDMAGEQVGTHNGLHTFTVGQRRGINCPASEPYYVKRIDPGTNTLHVCFKKDLAQKEMWVSQLIWNETGTDRIIDVTTKIRYSHRAAASRLEIEGSQGRVIFEDPQNAVTPGQGAVFYIDNRVAGSGIIT